ncbi:MAG: hypothetical protein MZV63_31175 [Marinilabiliales bacterium]|nr:hypothetical protein [Marinilabiliales bacterium]
MIFLEKMPIVGTKSTSRKTKNSGPSKTWLRPPPFQAGKVHDKQCDEEINQVAGF